MRRPVLLLLLLALLAPSIPRAAEDKAPPSPPPAPGPDLAAPPIDPVEPPPPGTPADQALWAAAGDVSNRVYLKRTEANKLQWEIRKQRPDERLAAIARTATGDEAKRIEDLRGRLLAAWTKNYEILVSRWPVDPTRGCQYQQLLLGSSMHAGDGPRINQARDEARACVDVASRAVARLEASTRELEAVVAEAAQVKPTAATPGTTSAKE